MARRVTAGEVTTTMSHAPGPPPSPFGNPPSRNLGPNDAAAMMRYDAGRKSTGVAYLLWFFLGVFGAHRFYLGRIGSGLALLALTALSWVLSFVLVGYLLAPLPFLWVIVDLFLIPGMARSHNERLIASLGH